MNKRIQSSAIKSTLLLATACVAACSLSSDPFVSVAVDTDPILVAIQPGESRSFVVQARAEGASDEQRNSLRIQNVTLIVDRSEFDEEAEVQVLSLDGEEASSITPRNDRIQVDRAQECSDCRSFVTVLTNVSEAHAFFVLTASASVSYSRGDSESRPTFRATLTTCGEANCADAIDDPVQASPSEPSEEEEGES